MLGEVLVDRFKTWWNGEAQLIEVEENPLITSIEKNRCPDCGGEGFLQGPSGGISTNIMCANEKCKAKFNIMVSIGLGKILRVDRL